MVQAKRLEIGRMSQRTNFEWITAFIVIIISCLSINANSECI
jgi:hypothetical protein